MGEIAEMMLEGELCEGCGEYLGDGDGFPRRCRACSPPTRRPRPAATAKRGELESTARAYLNTVAHAKDGVRERPAIWNDPRFQACHEAGYVSYQRTSNRWRLVRATPAGRAYLGSTRRGGHG